MRIPVWMLCFVCVRCMEPPGRVHLSLGDTPDKMVVLWSTRKNVTSAVHYGDSPDNMRGRQYSDVHHVDLRDKQYQHRAVLQGLEPNTRYWYQVVSRYKEEFLYSRVFSFKTIDTKSNGDTVIRSKENISAGIPYMTAPDNHGIKYAESFVDYLRFNNPEKLLWYSYNVGQVHFISYSTEVHFTRNHADVCDQFYWLLDDLVRANENRASQPWIVALGHRTTYCSGDEVDDSWASGWVRRGLEDLFYAQGVDLIIQANEHSNERMYPMYKNKLVSKEYVNLTAPVHIKSGGEEGNDSPKFKIIREPWSAYRHSNYGDHTYGRLNVHNASHLYWEQVRVEGGSVINSLWIVQYNHGPFVKGLNCSANQKHPSCQCPPIFPYVTVIVSVTLAITIIILTIVIVCTRRCIRRRRLLKYHKLDKKSNGEDDDDDEVMIT